MVPCSLAQRHYDDSCYCFLGIVPMPVRYDLLLSTPSHLFFPLACIAAYYKTMPPPIIGPPPWIPGLLSFIAEKILVAEPTRLEVNALKPKAQHSVLREQTLTCLGEPGKGSVWKYSHALYVSLL